MSGLCGIGCSPASTRMGPDLVEVVDATPTEARQDAGVPDGFDALRAPDRPDARVSSPDGPAEGPGMDGPGPGACGARLCEDFESYGAGGLGPWVPIMS